MHVHVHVLLWRFQSLCVQEYLTSGDWDDVEDLEEKLESYKSKLPLSRRLASGCILQYTNTSISSGIRRL